MKKPYLDLLDASFPGIKNNIIRCHALGASWESSKLFLKEENGQTLSHVALLECPMLVEGKWHTMGWLHGICTKESHRGRGFATQLIHEAIQVGKDRCEFLLLITGIPSFYEKLSFLKIQEHRFYLPQAFPKGSKPSRPITATKDHELFLRCFQESAPLSNRVWIKDNGTITAFNSLFMTYPTYWSLHYCPAFDGVLSYEVKDGKVHLYDVIAKKMPTLNVILDHLPASNGIYFYFSPDQFTDNVIIEPYLYDNGHLMVYGKWHMPKPFMVPPLSRC